jgi:hypothetical protein
MAMSPRVQKSSSSTPKTTISTTNDHEFQTHELVVCKAKTTVVPCMEESKKGKWGEEK